MNDRSLPDGFSRQEPPRTGSSGPATLRQRSMLTVKNHDDREESKRPLEWNIIWRLFGYTLPYRTLMVWLLVCVLIRSVQLPALTWLVASVIKGPVADGDREGVVWGSISFALLAVSTQVVMHFRQKLALVLGESIVHDLRNELFAHVQTLNMQFFHETKLGRMISRMGSDVELVRAGVQDVFFVSVVQVGQMAVAAAAMLWYDWQLFLLVVCIAPVLYLLNMQFHARLSHSLRVVQESFSRVTATLAESVNGIRVTQGFARQQKNAQLFSDLIQDHSEINMDVRRVQGLYLPLLDLIGQAFIALLLAVGGYRVLVSGSVDVGDMVAFFFMAGLFFSPITVIGNQYNTALEAMAGAERVFRLLDRRPDWSDPPDALELAAIQGRVEFRDVTFGYVPRRPVLHQINFVAEPGQSVALVGATGSGKTSITNLIAKFYQPQQGEVLVDGISLNSVKTGSFRSQLGIVQQQNFLFTGTVLDNIRFARPNATENEVRQALKELECLDLIEELPQGLNTKVGERGSGLSLGQRQLVCFARALIADPRILILDEATSSVDTVTEARVQKSLEKLLAGRTSFIIAHRLSTISAADQILVLSHGKIVERGTHESLLRNSGIYSSLYQSFISGANAQ